MPALRSLPRGLPRPTRRPPSLGRSALLTVLALALGGCNSRVNLPSLRELFARDGGGLADFVDPDGTPSPEVNTTALAALTAAAAAATQAALVADEPSLAAAATAAFGQTLDAKAPPSLVSNGQLEAQTGTALTNGILSGLDGPAGPAPRAAAVWPAVIAAARKAGYQFDQQRITTVLTEALAANQTAWTLRAFERAVRADPATAAAQLTAAIQRAPDQAAALLRVALQAAPAEHPAIVAAATTSTQGTNHAASVAAVVTQANREWSRRTLQEGLRTNPADAVRLLAAAVRQAPDLVTDWLSTALAAAPQQAPAILSAAIEAFPPAARPGVAALLTTFVISLAPAQAALIKGAALQTATTLGLPLATLETLKSLSLTPGSAASLAQTVATGSTTPTTPTQAPGSTTAPQLVPPVATSAQASSAGGPPAGKIDLGFILRNREFATLKVLYGTERKRTMPYEEWRKQFDPAKDSTKPEFYGRERDDVKSEFHYGRCYVSIPTGTETLPVHRKGKIERPGTFASEKIQSHFMLRGITELSEDLFKKDIVQLTLPDPARGFPNGKDAFIFIHGFNVNFNEAVMRAAQMAYDFGFLGAPIVYSWASRGSAMITGMQHDQDVNAATVKELRKFVETVQRQTAGKLHLVAHSMGNRALIGALKELALVAQTRKDLGHTLEWRPGRDKLFGEIVLAAPDVSNLLFKAEDAAAIKELGERITLYVSDDRALLFARLFSSIQRIGEAGPRIFSSIDVDTINATGADKSLVGLHHSYPFEVQSVLADLRAVLVEGAKPDSTSRNLIKDTATATWRLITRER